jgi:hypothetical protein
LNKSAAAQTVQNDINNQVARAPRAQVVDEAAMQRGSRIADARKRADAERQRTAASLRRHKQASDKWRGMQGRPMTVAQMWGVS